MADVKNLGERLSAQFRGLNGRNPGQWPLAPRALCALGVLLVVVALGWFLYWNGQLEQLELGEMQEQKLKDEYKIKIQQAVNLPGLRKQKEQVGEYVATLEKQLPSKAEMDALLQDISQAGQGRGLQFELFKPGQVLVKEYYAELPIDIRITGNFHDIGAFSSDIANLPRIVTINNVSLVAGKDRLLSMDAVAKTFRYLDKDEVSAQRQAAAPKKGKK
ncbi:type 4a pilus biogenesis protein PilO [Lacisediminimonas sp.]|uniref:type 4a pilus biogenesis protein PilO n=1 Tax=Lacisediminimonas sp. TaxID=3060582 RepID=UPI00272678BC|nr:type 4a pilus biogenesis protein PilO [Lacisediminimonas sp.]MDO8299889.1 type 4a pilus biogenesis protein PilO [Lacisediminimonas sp.]MDO9218751.1 type 4a pilus biogenesis protein PilO [Lacisediminimonas sp.]